MKFILGFVLAFVSFTAATTTVRADVANFGMVVPGIYRGAQPENENDYQILKAHGIKTIINLRADKSVQDEAQIAKKLGIRFLNAPMLGGIYPKEEIVNAALRAMGTRSLGPIFIHCEKGEARTGLVVGLFRVYYQHWTTEQAYKEMEHYGFNSLHFALKLYWANHTK